ncbi:MAG: class I SAM-dependent methyltransferase [Desulfuromonadaceae bacterium]
MKRFTPHHAQRMDAFLDRLECHIYPELASQLHSDITQRAITRLTELEPLHRGARVLDVGCGQGPALELFDQMDISAVGVTLGAEDIEACRSRGFSVARMDQSFLDFEDNTFDVIWARHVIEHSIFPFYTLHEFNRVMRHSGMLYLEVPAPDTDCHHERNPNHYSVLSQSAWCSLLERTGLTIIDTVSYRFSVMAGDDEYFGFYCKKT